MPISEPREDVPDRWRCTRCRQCRSCSATCLPTRLTAMDREKTAYAASCAVSDCRKHRKALGFRLGPGSRHWGIRRRPASAAIFWATQEEGSGVRPKYVGRGGLPKGMGWKAPRPESPRRRNKPLRHPLASELRACGEDS
jgi:hypothetical protein